MSESTNRRAENRETKLIERETLTDVRMELLAGDKISSYTIYQDKEKHRDVMSPEMVVKAYELLEENGKL